MDMCPHCGHPEDSCRCIIDLGSDVVVWESWATHDTIALRRLAEALPRPVDDSSGLEEVTSDVHVD